MAFDFFKAFAYLQLNPSPAMRNLMDKYDEPHRHYHNYAHINSVLNYIDSERSNFTETEFIALVLAGLYHDAIYEIGTCDNEHQSSVFMAMEVPHFSDEIIKLADRLIMLTSAEGSHHTNSSDRIGNVFLMADLHEFLSLADIIKNSRLIFKEFQKYDWSEYKKGRVLVLEKIRDKSVLQYSDEARENINYEILRLSCEVPKIGLYAGSFNPFHIGHLNILEKAEKVFDKVIIGFAQNPDKHKHIIKVPSTLKNHQVEPIEGFLTDFLASKDYDLTIIKGLRNSTDLTKSVEDYRWMEELAQKKVNVVSFFCDAELEFVSSTNLRNIERVSGTKDRAYTKYIVK